METLVRTGTADYPELKVDSCVNCNKVFSKPISELVAQWGDLEKKPADLPCGVLQKVLEGIELSPEVAEEEKALVRMGEEA